MTRWNGLRPPPSPTGSIDWAGRTFLRPRRAAGARARRARMARLREAWMVLLVFLLFTGALTALATAWRGLP